MKQQLLQMDIDKYLHRIDVSAREQPGVRFLKHLHYQHLLHIPFENLDIHWGKEILLDTERLYKKIIEQKRGGFCYELNGLFYSLLTQLGFTCYMASARMPKPDGNLSPEFEHMCILVQLAGEVFLCDVGYGKGPVYPLKVLEENIQMSLNQFYRIRKKDEVGWWLDESDDGQAFEEKYLFSPKRRTLIEFIPRCLYQQTDPESHFRNGKMITQATPEGRKTLTEKMLIVNSRGKRTEHYLLNEDDFYIKLEEHFNIHRSTN
ncbi:MAG: arylamine N-acetyltransferase [Imperialibacter sp.]|uniref:arylamine N-acetyltransferase family protein n=1 Tax=Imperialibacter sp. TaxID=2038411 RepID=UPI0032ECBB54